MFAERALTRGRTVSTVVGPADAVETFWDGAAAVGPAARAALGPAAHGDRPPAAGRAGPATCAVPPATTSTQVYPACVAMYTEEVGVSPELRRRRELYRARVSQLVCRGWSFARFEDGRLVFKAEVACASPYAAQVQGVWVAPDRRGEGLAVPRDGGRGRRWSGARSRRWCRSTSTTATSRPGGPTSGSASGRRRVHDDDVLRLASTSLPALLEGDRPTGASLNRPGPRASRPPVMTDHLAGRTRRSRGARRASPWRLSEVRTPIWQARNSASPETDQGRGLHR